jgi:hypothetical protein
MFPTVYVLNTNNVILRACFFSIMLIHIIQRKIQIMIIKYHHVNHYHVKAYSNKWCLFNLLMQFFYRVGNTVSLLYSHYLGISFHTASSDN